MKYLQGFFVIGVLFLGSLVTTISSNTTFNAYAEESFIPKWIKNNAGWWAEGLITDDEFAKGIEYLIKNEIMMIPSAEQTENICPGNIPSCIKNNAGWWAEDQIDDNSFIEGIQHLIKEEIIVISNGLETEFIEAKEQMCDVLKQIKETHANPLIKSLLPEIPVVGNLLSDIYENSHSEDRLSNIEKLLENYIRMNDNDLRQEIDKLQENKNEIIQNRDYLEQLVDETNIIIMGIDGIEQRLIKAEKERQIIIDYFDKLFDELGIVKQVVIDKKIEVTSEIFKEVENENEKFEKLNLEIVELTNKAPQIDYNYLLKLANLYYYSEEYQKAIEIYDEILIGDSSDVDTLINKGVALMKLERYEDAIKVHDIILSIENDHLSTLINKGVALMKLERYEDAIKVHDIILSIENDHLSTLKNKANALMKLEKYSEAINVYNIILNIDPNDEGAKKNKEIAEKNLNS